MSRILVASATTMATSIDWKPFLARWSHELMSTELASRVDPPPESNDWLGFAPASEEQLEQLEQRLGLMLPPSYRSFLRTTNGWRRTTPFIGRVRPAEEVDWFRVENEQWAALYAEHGSDLPDEEYYDYSNHAELHHRAEHMMSLIQISDVEDGVYLLNPEALTPDGEWEAWFFANWVPGARRFPSFAHMMLSDHKSFTNLEKVAGSGRGLPKLKTPSPDVPRVPAEHVRARTKRAQTFEALIEGMKKADAKDRGRATRTFHGKLMIRGSSPRRPDLIKPLCELFYASTDPHVRCACISALTNFAADDDAPPALFDALSDPDPSVFLHGVWALHYFPDERALEPLCTFINSRVNVLYNESAIQALADMGNERAIPTLLRVLLDTSNTFDQNFGTAALALARCGPEAFDHLAAALLHEDARVRHAAVVGLDCSGDPRAATLLDGMQDDPDPNVRQRAKVRVGRPWYWDNKNGEAP